MSWMDSWSRPAKHSAVPPPLYSTSGEDVPYCSTCGRIISARKSQKRQNMVVKYCSERCRNHRRSRADKKVEKAIIALLNGSEESGVENTAAQSKMVKGDRRIIVTMDEIEEIVFGSRHDPSKTFGRKKNRPSRALFASNDERTSIDMEDEVSDPVSDAGVKVTDAESLPSESQAVKPGPMVRPPQTESEVNFSVGGERGRAEKIEESAESLEKRREGDRRVEEREIVRRAARRGIVFGFVVEPEESSWEASSSKSKGRTGKERSNQKKSEPREVVDEPPRRKCEALMNGAIVEPSFAKGNWSIRWREQH